MRKIFPYIKLSLASLLLAISLTAALWECRINTPTNSWSKIATIRSPSGKTTSYQMMVYVDRPIMRSDQTCKTYLRIKNAGKHPLELTSTYMTNHYYINGELYGEEIGDWQIPGSPLRLLPGAVKNVYFSVLSTRHPERISKIGFYGFSFFGWGLRTNTVTVYVLPSRPFWIVLTVVAAFAVWRAWLGTKLRQRQNQ